MEERVKTLQLAICLFACIFLSRLPCYAQTVQYFPQLADGGGYVTTWYFCGLGDGPAQIRLELFDQRGVPLTLSTEQGLNGVFNLSVLNTGSTSLKTLGAGDSVKVGWAKVTSNLPVGATEIFQLFGSGGQLISQAGVLPSAAIAAATMLVTNDSRRGTGIAIANVQSTGASIGFKLYDKTGTRVATSSRLLPPGNQIALFVNQLDGFENIGLFNGTLEISGNLGFAAVSLIFDGQEIATVPTLRGRISLLSSNTVHIPAISWLWLAAMPAGFTSGNVSVPLNSPIEAGIAVIPGWTVQMSATGTVKSTQSSSTTYGPDGGGSVGYIGGGLPTNGIGDIHCVDYALIGVFLDMTEPALPRPATLDFSGAAKDLTLLQPQLKQPFLIGSGSTSAGQARKILVPNGASRLFLGIMDDRTNISDNAGAFSVTLSTAPPQ
jgi:hypothetical protein